MSIHAEAPDFVDMSVTQEVLETGIKVVDLLAPYAKGGKIGKSIKYGKQKHAVNMLANCRLECLMVITVLYCLWLYVYECNLKVLGLLA